MSACVLAPVSKASQTGSDAMRGAAVFGLIACSTAP
jgi:hypothetical protein